MLAQAQAPKGSDQLTPLAVAESLFVLRQLDSVVGRNPGDAAAWHRRGMIAWALSERDRHQPPVAGLDWTRLGRMADTSLRIAASIDKSNAYYGLMAGRYLLASGTPLSRAASYGMFDAAVAAARNGADPYTHSEAAIEAGRVFWRRYDALANRWMQLQSDIACEPPTAMLGREEVARLIDQVKQCSIPADFEGSGESDYRQAETLFREAFDAQPSNQRAFRQLAMLLVERKRWTELGALTRARLAGAPWDAWAWLTLGLVMHERHGGVSETVAVFDSAFTLLPPEERQWFSRFERVLRPEDTTKVQSSDPGTRFALHRLFWLTANPLWSQDATQPQLDFLSRLVYSELRWTVEELNVRGADTDRGDVYIRYGPPDVIMSHRTESAVITSWVYDIGLVFTFTGQPTFATARIAPNDQQTFGDIVHTAPVRWMTAPGFTLDSMPAQLARFRARGDSVDVIVAALPPVESMAVNSMVRGMTRSDFWLLAGGTVVIARDSVVPTGPGVQVFTHRVRERNYLFRAEASTTGSLHAARASAAFVAGTDSSTGFGLRGFGISDVLLATRVAEGRNRALRWNDFDVAPLAGPVSRANPLSLLWENYDFSNDRGASHYTVAIIVERDLSPVGSPSRPAKVGNAISAAILSRVTGAIGVERADDRIKLRFERTIQHAAVTVDHVDLSLRELPAGPYRLTIEITDLGTGHTASRTTRLDVSDR